MKKSFFIILLCSGLFLFSARSVLADYESGLYCTCNDSAHTCENSGGPNDCDIVCGDIGGVQSHGSCAFSCLCADGTCMTNKNNDPCDNANLCGLQGGNPYSGSCSAIQSQNGSTIFCSCTDGRCEDNLPETTDCQNANICGPGMVNNQGAGSCPAAQTPGGSVNKTPSSGTKYLPNALGKNTSLPVIIGTIIKGAMGVMGALVLLMLVWGGFQWLTSAGSPEKVKKGTQTMVWAVIGAFLALSSYFILNIILTFLTTGKTPGA